MNLQLENKLALVTGSTAGIGFAIAKGLAAALHVDVGTVGSILEAPR